MNGTHHIKRPLQKSTKSLELRYKYFSANKTSIRDFPFILYLMHQIINWVQSSCRRKSKTTISFYSQQLNTGLKRYKTTERDKEFLSAIETCKKSKNILLGYPIIVFIDHKNKTFNGLKTITSDRVLRTCWLLLLEEYGITFEYLP
jgi:hypothetical protein